LPLVDIVVDIFAEECIDADFVPGICYMCWTGVGNSGFQSIVDLGIALCVDLDSVHYVGLHNAEVIDLEKHHGTGSDLETLHILEVDLDMSHIGVVDLEETHNADLGNVVLVDNFAYPPAEIWIDNCCLAVSILE